MAGTYLKTHPWLKFELDLRHFDHEVWLHLGEAQSKCEHLSGVPLKPGTAERLHRIYLAKGVLATTAIEGNTLSVEQVEAYLDQKLKLPPSKEYLKREIENIVTACNLVIKRLVEGNPLPLTTAVISELNGLVLDRLDLAPDVVAGELRRHDVGVARYRGAPWRDCPFLMDRLSGWLVELEDSLAQFGTAGAILRAIIAHLYIAWIHPFGDGNGRTARLVEFAILVKAGVPLPAAHLLSDHYNETRTQYYRELDRASRSHGDIVPFVKYAVQGFVDGLRAQIEEVKKQQLDVAWTNYIHERLHQPGEVAVRRRKLVLALTERSEPVRTRDAMALTPELVRLYAGKTRKTLSRDVNALGRLKLVVQTGPFIRANTGIMLAFLPTRAPAA
jgi:Fic family protein